MASSIAFIDRRDGRLIRSCSVVEDYQKLSLRHLAVSPSGLVLFGAQHQGAAVDRPPLIGTLSMQSDIQMLALAPELLAPLKNYIASVCVLPGTETFVVSASRGGLALVLDGRSGELLQTLQNADGSGVAATESAFYSSSGDGGLRAFEREAARLVPSRMRAHPCLSWDHHLRVSAQ